MVKLSLALSLSSALLLTSASIQPIFAADFAAGVTAYHAEDFQTAYQEWKPLADEGDNAAQYNLGILYQFGLGVEQDVTQAVSWYTKSSEAGFADASLHMGRPLRQRVLWGTR